MERGVYTGANEHTGAAGFRWPHHTAPILHGRLPYPLGQTASGATP